MNEPVCTMATTVTDSEQNKWWPTESVEYQLKVPHQSDDTTQRIDFVNHKSYTGNSRHSSNPLIIPTKGICMLILVIHTHSLVVTLVLLYFYDYFLARIYFCQYFKILYMPNPNGNT